MQHSAISLSQSTTHLLFLGRNACARFARIGAFSRRLTVLFALGCGAFFSVSAMGQALNPNEFVSTWRTTATATLADRSITIPTTTPITVSPRTIDTYDYTIDCGTGGLINGAQMATGQTGNATCVYASAGDHQIIITGTFPRIYFGRLDGMFFGNSNPELDSTTDLGDDITNMQRDDFATNRNNLITVVQWGNVGWTSMEQAFAFAQQLTSVPNDTIGLEAVTNMRGMFAGAIRFSANIGNWDVSNVTNMNQMFAVARRFNRPIGNWDVSKVTGMIGMFRDANAFNQPIGNWNVSNVTSIRGMFSKARVFNQPLGNWDVSKVTSMNRLFQAAERFNQDINNWNVSNVEDMFRVFQNADDFNQPLSGWDVSGATEMKQMFDGSEDFNQDINGWDVSRITDMDRMFNNAHRFNQPLSGWDVSNVTKMDRMFRDAGRFNQDIGNWDVSSVTNMSRMFESNDDLSIHNYNALLRGWARDEIQPLQSGVAFHASAKYTQGAVAARAVLTDAPNSWDITGDSLTDNVLTVVNAIADQTATVGEAFNFVIPADAFVNEDGVATTYAAAPLPDGITFDEGSSRTFSGIPTTEGTTTVAVTATDSATPPLTATDRFNIVVVAPTIADTLNAQVLPQLARVLTSQINADIAQRVEGPRATDGEVGATFNFGGATLTNGDSADNSAALPTWLAQHGEDLVAGEVNMKSLLANSSFEMPLSAKQSADGQSSNLALWGRGNYSNIEDTLPGISYDGDVFGLSVGVDAPLGERGLGGVALSWSDSEIDYEDSGKTGEYQFELVSVHPYFGWREDAAKMWVRLGYGVGSLEVTPTSGAKQDSDVSMQSLAAGGSGRIMQTADGATELRGKGEVSIARLEVEDNGAFIGAAGIDVSQLKLALEATHTRELRGGASLQPSAEIGVRYDSGDGAGNNEAGIALRAGVKRIGGRLTIEGNVHGLFARGDYKEWGVDGLVRLNPGRDGQGLSLTLAPGLGDTTSEVERLWQQDLRHSVPTSANDADDIAPRLRATVGYGLTHKWQPYGEMTLANDNNRYGLGVRWHVKQAHGVGFHLNLIGEHRDTDTATNAILLQGKVEF